jgi:DNA-binding response OmpR family regulator
VLLLEDRPDVARSTKRFLERLGHEVVAVATCAEALAVRGPLHLAILDIELPDGSGVEVARQLLDAGLVATVLFFSGAADARVGDLGALVLKPDYPALRTAITEALATP